MPGGVGGVASRGVPLSRSHVDSGRLLRATQQLRSHPKSGNSLKDLQEIRTRSDAHGSISVQEGQPRIGNALAATLTIQNEVGKYPPAKPGALGLEPLEAAEGVADAAP